MFKSNHCAISLSRQTSGRPQAAPAARSGDRLHAVSISACGLRLIDEAGCVAVRLLSDTDLCEAHHVRKIDTLGSHALIIIELIARRRNHINYLS
jgi:dihydrodipicolinate reductase